MKAIARTSSVLLLLCLASLVTACSDPLSIKRYGYVETADSYDVAIPPERPRRSTASSTPTRTVSREPVRTTTVSSVGSYRVQRGDTLYAVSRKTGMDLRSLIDRNGLQPPYRLVVGQELRLPSLRYHQVRKGETLYGISRSYDVDMTELARANALRPPYSLAVGQRLQLPAGPQVQVVAAPATPHVSQTAPASNRYEVGVEIPPQRVAANRVVVTASARPAPQPRPAAVPAPTARSGKGFLWPVRGKVISKFGPQGNGQHNDGINILVARGSSVSAAENGVVAYAGNELRGFGNLLLIKHDGGWVTAYAHNDTLLVNRGQRVTRGQQIAHAGNSGSVSRSQVHFEIRRYSKAVNPLTVLK